jgi:hypothetical protein
VVCGECAVRLDVMRATRARPPSPWWQ